MLTNWLEYAILFVVAAVVTIALVPAAKKLAIKLNAIDYPSARRVNMMRAVLKPLRTGNVNLTMLQSSVISWVRQNSTNLFARLKANR